MKKTVLFATLALLGVFCFAQERIAVFPFEDRNNIFTKDQMDLFYIEFTNEFRNRTDDNMFTVLDRQEVVKVINMETKFQLSDYSSTEKTAAMQKVLNAKQIISGVIIREDNNNIRVTVSRYSFPQVTVLRGGARVTLTNRNQLFDKIPDLVQDMMSAITGATSQNHSLISANFVRVEGGTFEMGSTNGFNGETPVHTVTVKSFSMSKYEVTQKEWYEVMGTTIRQHHEMLGQIFFEMNRAPIHEQRDMLLFFLPLFGEGDNYPMYYVNWYEAVEYCNKRSIKEGLMPVYRGSGDNITCDWNANGYRLPTEAEWEFAAKGGTKDYITTEYSGSNSVDAVAWYHGNSEGMTHPVGMKVANSLGIHDMSGNVEEWCWDWYGSYSSSPQIDPRGPVSGKERVRRGGTSGSYSGYVRSTCRASFYPLGWNGADIFIHGTGFRVVRN